MHYDAQLTSTEFIRIFLLHLQPRHERLIESHHVLTT
jgi:hypothetical protein